MTWKDSDLDQYWEQAVAVGSTPSTKRGKRATGGGSSSDVSAIQYLEYY